MIIFKKIFSIENRPKMLGFLFLLFLALGIFLRTYNFHDWLRFNADQSRDAKVVSNFLESETSLPLLGPKAGGTDFRIGPAFYYFQIVSAKIFGSSPDKMAYFDLLFSVLSIPLLFLLMKRYFNGYVSLALAALLSVSLFSVQYGRFAWNPNSSPFFVTLFLYSFLRLADPDVKKKFIWAFFSGIALGIGIQLHTMLLFVMPAAAIIFFAYLHKNKAMLVREFAIVILIAMALNISQIFSEFQSGGQNLSAFFGGTAKKTANEISLGEKIGENFLCQVQSNNYIISAIGPSGDCGKTVISGEFKRHKHFDKLLPIVLETILGLIFTIGGFVFWLSGARKELNKEKKKFLVLLGIYFLVSIVILIPVANEISIRFYLALEFVPFLLLGFWADAIWKLTRGKHGKLALFAMSAIFILFVGSNIYKTNKMFAAFSSQESTGDDNVDNDNESFITLGETEFIADYIVSRAGQQSMAYLEGRQQFLFKYLRSINFFTTKKGIEVKEYSERENLPENAKIIFLGDFKNIKTLDSSVREKYFSTDIQSCGRFSIATLEKKP